MVKQPENETYDVNDLLYKAKRRCIDMLNQEYFRNVQLSEKENDVLVWLCGWYEWTIDAVISVFRKIRKLEDWNE